MMTSANEGAAFENIMPAKTSLKHSNLLSSADLALIESSNPSKKTKSIEMENGKKIIIRNFSF